MFLHGLKSPPAMEQYARAGTLYEVGLQNLGLALLRQELRTAALAFTKALTASYRAEEIHQSIMFVQGSGFDAMVEVFAIEVNPVQLRSTFFTWATRQSHKLASSSAITRDG